MPGRQSLWYYSHTLTIFFAVLLFTAGFLCVLLWTNNIVHTDTSSGGANTSTFTYLSPAVSTFSITYNVVSNPSPPLISRLLLTPFTCTGHLRRCVERSPFRRADHTGARLIANFHGTPSFRDREGSKHCYHHRERSIFDRLHGTDGDACTIGGRRKQSRLEP